VSIFLFFLLLLSLPQVSGGNVVTAVCLSVCEQHDSESDAGIFVKFGKRFVMDHRRGG